MSLLLIIGIATMVTTIIGGVFALYFKDRLHLITGFSAGAVLGVAFFDLIPEAFELGAMYREESTIAAIIGFGFLLYLIIDRTLQWRSGGEHVHEHRGTVGALSVCVHSFIDGLGIGFAFQVSPSVGTLVALAVLIHDFSDGINTVSFSLLGNRSERRAQGWLAANALAPLFGILVTFFFTVSESILGIILTLFAGFFLYLGASELLPESYHRHPRIWTTITTLSGAGVIYGAIVLAGI